MNSNVGLARWITAEGTIFFAELPIDRILKQAIDPEFKQFRSACVLLGIMAGAGRLGSVSLACWAATRPISRGLR
jgi:hypothetical protein